jgi:hypothetical protein
MFDIIAPEQVLTINVYWKSVILAGGLVCLISKLINWKRQHVKSYSSLCFLVFVMLASAVSLAIGMVRPGLLAFPHLFVDNTIYSMFLLYFAATKCWPTYRGSMVQRTSAMPLPMAFK